MSARLVKVSDELADTGRWLQAGPGDEPYAAGPVIHGRLTATAAEILDR